jgi:hypothetical protein
MELPEKGWEIVGWFPVAQDWDKSRGLVNDKCNEASGP